MSTPKDMIHAYRREFRRLDAKFFPWADPPVGSHDRQHGKRGRPSEANNYGEL